MTKKTVFVVEDEKNIVELLRFNLEQEDYRVLSEMRGDFALEKIRKEQPDLILLDIMLPELDGIEICKILKQNPKTKNIPIIILTAKGEELDKIIGLELGADDYVTKPFSPRELMARIKAVLRRGQSIETKEVLKSGLIEIDTAKHQVTLKGKSMELTSKEYDLLCALMRADGRVLTREYLLDKVWGYDQSLNIETRTVDMHIGQLRKKLKTDADRIMTVKNVGYRFDYDL